jgi:hypothetical protein
MPTSSHGQPPPKPTNLALPPSSAARGLGLGWTFDARLADGRRFLAGPGDGCEHAFSLMMRLFNLLRWSFVRTFLPPSAILSDIALAGWPGLFMEKRLGRSFALSVLARGLLRPLARAAAPAAAPAPTPRTFASLPAVFAFRFGSRLIAGAFRRAFLPLVVLLLVLVLV